VKVRNPDGSPAIGVRYKLSYSTPSQREVTLDRGTPSERKFQFETFRIIAPISAGIAADDGTIRLLHLAGAPRRFSLHVGDDGTRPGDFAEGGGFLEITFTNRAVETNVFILDLPKTVALGERAPDFLVKDVFTGRSRTLADFNGKIVVLKFWATTCAPCQPEMEKHNELIARQKRFWSEKVAFVAVGMDEDGKRLKEHIQKKDWTQFQHVWAEDTNGAFSSAIAQSYGIHAIPASYVIHPTGVVVWRGDTEQIKGIVDALLTDVKEPKDVQEWLKAIEEARASR
jgi:peroxiredoxin